MHKLSPKNFGPTIWSAVVAGILLSTTILHGAESAPDQKQSNVEKMEWFTKARLGIFVHWGIYSVNGIDESWSFFNRYLSREDYMKQLNGFTAERYDPVAWASLIKGSGARYAVIATKHHDGVALWDTKANDMSVAKKTPAKRDVLTPLMNALRSQGLKIGAYYSLMDWSHPDFPAENREQSRGGRSKWLYRPEDDAARWNRFMDFNFIQYKEIIQQYNPDLWWFDGHWWFSAKEWRSKETAELLRSSNPKTIINDRLPGEGDYETTEQGIPLVKRANTWEACMTINESWGYQPADVNYKSIHDVIGMLTDCIHFGGNLLLDIGPKPDGTIPDEQAAILRGLGRWTSKHQLAIYDTRPGIDLAYYNGPSALGSTAYLGSKSGEILYLFVPHRPNGAVRLKGLMSQIQRAWVVGNGAKVNWRRDTDLMTPGITYLTIPSESLDPEVTVVALLLDGPIKLQELKSGAEHKVIAPAGATTGQ